MACEPARLSSVHADRNPGCRLRSGPTQHPFGRAHSPRTWATRCAALVWLTALERAGHVLSWDTAADLARLARLAPLVQVRQAIEELGPTLAKLGQILVERADLFGPAWIAEGNQRSAAALLPAPPQSVAAPAVSQRGECGALALQIEHWDAMAWQPQSAQMQDWIRVQQHKTRDRQWALRCWHWQKIPHRNTMVGLPRATGRVITHQKDGRWYFAPGRGVASLAPPWRVTHPLTVG